MHFTFALGIVMLIAWLLPTINHFTPMGKPPVFMLSSGPLKGLRIAVSVVTAVFLFVDFFDYHVPTILRIIASCLLLVSLAAWAAVWALCLEEESYIPMENHIVTIIYIGSLPVGMAAAALQGGNWILLILALSLSLVRWLCARPYLKTIKSKEFVNAM